MARTVASIINDLGGLSSVAKALGHANPTTVQGWKQRRSIPVRHFEALIELGRARGIDLTVTDLVAAQLPASAAA